MIWFLGAAVILLRLALGTWKVGQLAREGARVEDGVWLSLTQRLANRLGVSRPMTLLRGERKLHLDGGLAILTERERMALLLRDVEEIPADQVAIQMNCSMATVRSHIANARTKFKRYLEARNPS
jgi:DNA-directed RNA polymerase specialized sigma24 family protein